MHCTRISFFALLGSLLLLSACNNAPATTAITDNGFEEQLQEKIDHAREGDVIELPEGTYELATTLLVKNAKNLTIKGQGREKTILIFKGLHGGDAGFTITADGTQLQDFTLLNPKGDGIKADDVRGIAIKQVRVKWSTRGSNKNGSFGFHFSGCYSILVESCEATNAANAGIYIAKSRDAVLRRNHISSNVAGIELENSSDIDIHDNLVDSNAVGMFLCSLPGSAKKNMSRCRIFNNRVLHNNLPNYSAKGTLLSEIPSGTGIMVLATSYCQVYGNNFTDNHTVGTALLSHHVLQKPGTDEQYDPYCSGIFLRENNYESNGNKPDENGVTGALLKKAFASKVPDIVYDGTSNPAYKNSNGSTKDERRICLSNNTGATFGNMNLQGGGHLSSDASKFDCTLPALNDVKLN